MTDLPESREPETDLHEKHLPETGLPDHDLLLDERGARCPVPVIALARAVKTDPTQRLVLLSDDPAATTDIPAWCSLRGRSLAWSGPAPDGGGGTAFLVVPGEG